MRIAPDTLRFTCRRSRAGMRVVRAAASPAIGAMNSVLSTNGVAPETGGLPFCDAAPDGFSGAVRTCTTACTITIPISFEETFQKTL